ncbi:MAG: NAD(+) synthase [Balneolaceae bacterium]|nr:NAD(+) synthase [Balneolaceae bacterium]
MPKSFQSIYSHDFIRCAVAIPALALSDPARNARNSAEMATKASEHGAAVCLFPELGLTGYSNEDLFHQTSLLRSVREALTLFLQSTRNLDSVLVVGAPLKIDHALYNCAIVIHGGSILGVVPKSYLPNYREYYEKRQFTPGGSCPVDEIELCHQEVPFGSNLVFADTRMEQFKLHVEICEDLWVPAPPSTFGAMAGATIIANPSASNVTVTKADYRRQLCRSQSARTVTAYLYAGAGTGESTTDLAWDGHGMIYENGELLSETDRFAIEEQLIFSDIDLDRLSQDRMRLTSYNDNIAQFRERLRAFRTVPFTFDLPHGVQRPERTFFRFPYVPADLENREERCKETYNIQVQSLYKRMKSTGIKNAVIGISGGLDSTHALIVTAKTMDLLDLPRTNIKAYTMPGFATSSHTRENAHRLMETLGVERNEIDIRPSSRQMLEDIGHPYADDEKEYDVTFENVQAGDRTSHLFRLANLRDGLVIGTGDLSELALGWTTYGVGDQMSHYNVNVSVPKTLIQYLVRWVADNRMFGDDASETLYNILDTEISPELVPDENGNNDRPSQSTEAVIGPYELQDFHLYYLSRYGYPPSKVAFMCHHAWKDRSSGPWPEPYPDDLKNEYTLGEIKKWLKVFLERFFTKSQFKRSAIPNGPKVGSGGSLSPRSDWRAPSDSNAEIWLEELERNVP